MEALDPEGRPARDAFHRARARPSVVRGASAPVPRETSGAAIAANLARKLAPRVTHLCLISPAGFPLRRFDDRPTRSYREAGDDEGLFREICRHHLFVNMLGDPASVTEETVDIQADCVREPASIAAR